MGGYLINSRDIVKIKEPQEGYDNLVRMGQLEVECENGMRIADSVVAVLKSSGCHVSDHYCMKIRKECPHRDRQYCMK